MVKEETALGILAFVSVIAAVGLFVLQDADTTVSGQAASYYFLTSGRADTGEPPNKNVDVRGEVPVMCRDAFDCAEGYDCKTVRVEVEYFHTQPKTQTEYQKRCVKIE